MEEYIVSIREFKVKEQILLYYELFTLKTFFSFYLRLTIYHTEHCDRLWYLQCSYFNNKRKKKKKRKKEKIDNNVTNIREYQ